MKKNKGNNQDSGADLNLAYTRISTVFQEDNTSIELQGKHIAGTAALSDDKIDEWLHDTDSGGSDDREGFNRMMEIARSGNVRKIYVYSLDRFARDLLISEQAHHELRLLGVKVVSVREQLTDGPAGNLLRQMVSAFAEYEKAIITIRLHEGRNRKVQKDGTHQGGEVFGYRSVPGGKGQLVIEPTEAGVVRMVFEIREKGFSCDAISNYLNDKGYLTNRGSVFRHGMVRRILQHEAFYRGETTIAKKVNAEQIAHEPILPPRELGTPDLCERIPAVKNRCRVYDDNGGYQARSPHLGRHFINADILEAARIILTMKADGKTYKEIRDAVNERGLKPCNRAEHTTETVRLFVRNAPVWLKLLEDHGVDFDENAWSYRKPHPRDVPLSAKEIAMAKTTRELYEPRQLTLEQIAEKLNEQGFTDSQGGRLTKVQVHRMLKGWGRYQNLPKELIATEEELARSPLESSLLELKHKTEKRGQRPPKRARYEEERSAA